MLAAAQTLRTFCSSCMMSKLAAELLLFTSLFDVIATTVRCRASRSRRSATAPTSLSSRTARPAAGVGPRPGPHQSRHSFGRAQMSRC